MSSDSDLPEQPQQAGPPDPPRRRRPARGSVPDRICTTIFLVLALGLGVGAAEEFVGRDSALWWPALAVVFGGWALLVIWIYNSSERHL